MSANPGGRSKVDKRFGDVWDKRDEYPGFDGIEKAAALLAEIAFGKDGQPKDRLRAIEIWMSYRCGKPKETVDVGFGVSPEQLAMLEALKLTPVQRVARQHELAESDEDPPLEATESDEPTEG